MIEKTAYLCGFCKRIYFKKENCEKHEPECYHNPIMAACCTCGNLEIIHVDDFGSFDGGTRLECNGYWSNETECPPEVPYENHCSQWREKKK